MLQQQGKFYFYSGSMPHGEMPYGNCVFLVSSEPIPNWWKLDVEGGAPWLTIEGLITSPIKKINHLLLPVVCCSLTVR